MLVDWSEDREVFRLDEEFDAAGHAGLSCDEAGPLEGEEHLVDGARRHPEVALQVGFGRRSPKHLRIGVDRGEILLLRRSEARSERRCETRGPASDSCVVPSTLEGQR